MCWSILRYTNGVLCRKGNDGFPRLFLLKTRFGHSSDGLAMGRTKFLCLRHKTKPRISTSTVSLLPRVSRRGSTPLAVGCPSPVGWKRTQQSKLYYGASNFVLPMFSKEISSTHHSVIDLKSAMSIYVLRSSKSTLDGVLLPVYDCTCYGITNLERCSQ